MKFRLATFSSGFNEFKQFDTTMIGETHIVRWPGQEEFGEARFVSNCRGEFQTEKFQVFHTQNIEDYMLVSSAIRLTNGKTIVGVIDIIADNSGLFFGKIFTDDELAEIGEDNSGQSPEQRIAMEIYKEMEIDYKKSSGVKLTRKQKLLLSKVFIYNRKDAAGLMKTLEDLGK